MLLQPFLAFQREPGLARLPEILLYSNCKWLFLCAQMAYPLKMWGRRWGRGCFPLWIKQFWKKPNLEVWFSELHLRQEKPEQRETFPTPSAWRPSRWAGEMEASPAALWWLLSFTQLSCSYWHPLTGDQTFNSCLIATSSAHYTQRLIWSTNSEKCRLNY